MPDARAMSNKKEEVSKDENGGQET